MLKISNTLLAVSQLTNEKSAKTAQKFMVYLDKVYRSVRTTMPAEDKRAINKAHPATTKAFCCNLLFIIVLMYSA